MSCSNCGSKTAGCGCTDTAYTTPKVYTCPPDTSCPQPVRCSEFMDAACIFLNDGIADAGIQPGSSLESIIQQLILLVTNPGCVDAPGGVPGGGTVTFINAVWPGNAITIAGGPISNSGTFVFNGNGNSNQYIDGQGNLQDFPAISGPVEFQTNGTPNSTQDLLNLVAGTGVTLTESGGSVTIDVDAVTYSVQNGLSEQLASSGVFELGAPSAAGAPLLHDTYIEAAGFGFDIHAASLIYYQGNRVEVESGSAGALILSTGGTNDNSVEVDGTEVAIESIGGSNTTKIFLDPLKIRVQTPLFNIKNNNDVLTLIDSATGEVEFMPPAGILLQTNGLDNGDQTYLNLIQGNGVVLTNVDGDVTIDGPTFQTDGTDNSIQTVLNLVPGTGITMSESNGSVTINAEAPAINLTTNQTGGASTYNAGTGDLNIPIYQSQIDVQDEGVSKVINPTVLNFVGDGVEVTTSGSQAIITIPGGGGGSADANNGLILNTADYPTPTVQIGDLPANPAPFVRDSWINTVDFDFHIEGDRDADPVLDVKNIGQFTAVKGDSAGGYAIHGVTASGFSGYFEANTSLIGLYSLNKSGLLAGEFETISSVNNTILPVLRIARTVDTGNPLDNGADGIGASVDFILEDDTNVAAPAGAISYEFTDATSAAVVSQFSVTTADASILSRKLEITGAGQLILNNYTGASSFSGAPYSGAAVGVLKVDNQGHVFVGPAGTGGGYDSNNGIYNNSDIFQLGVDNASISTADFLSNRFINANAYSLNINGPGNTIASGVLYVAGGDYGIEARGVVRGIAGIATGSSASSYGGYFEGYNCLSLASFNAGGSGILTVLSGGSSMVGSELFNGLALTFEDADAASLYTAAKFRRADYSTVGPQQNIGIKLDLECSLQASASSSVTNSIVSKLFQTGTSTAKTQFEIQGLTNGVASLTPQFTILGGGTSGPAGAWSLTPGQIKFDRYALGAIYKSANDLSTNSGYNLGIDSNGNIWATDFSTSGGGGGGGTVTNVTGATANGFTVGVTSPTTSPVITVSTNVTGVLVGNGTGVSAVTGTGVMVFSGTGYTFQSLPTVNDGAIAVGATGTLTTGLSVNLENSAGGAFTANKSTSSTYRVNVGPAITDYVNKMTLAPPAGLPSYLTKSAQDTITLATPVTTFSPGTTGFTISNGISTDVTTPLAGPVVLGGVLGVTGGGTGNTTVPGEGQILVGNATGGFNVVTISGSGGTSVTANAGGITISSSPGSVVAKSGTYVNADGSVRLGSGAQASDPPAGLAPSPLLERAIVRLDSWLFRLADGADGVVSDLGFDVSDLANVKRGYLGTTTSGFWFSSSASGAAAPTSAFQGFVYGGQTSNAFPTNMSGFLFTPSGSAAFPTIFSGFGVDVTGSRTITGFLGTNVYEIINRTGNTITQYGLWGGTGGTANFLMYQANATSKLISIGDVSLLGGQTRFQIDDAALRYNFRKGNIYATDYGTGTPVGLDASSVARYTLATASNGKFYEIPAISLGSIVVGINSYTPTTLATAGVPNALTIQGAGTVSVGLSGSILTITGSTSAFPYWSTLSFSVLSGSSGTINTSTSGTSTIIPDVNGANTLNIQAGNNIDISTVDSTTNRLIISATTPNSWGNISFTGNSSAAPLNTGTILSPDTPNDLLTINAGVGIGVTVASNTDTFNIINTGVTQIVAGTGISITSTGASGTGSVTINSAAALASTNGVWQHPGAPATPTEYRLGSDTDGASTFTQDRWINAQSSFLQIKGTPATGDANGILKLLSTGVGRALRVENSNTSPNGAIYATSGQLTSTDAAPTGTIYGNSSGIGSAIVGDGSDTAGANTRPAIFGKGYIGAKGSNTTAQAAGLAAGGIGVYGTSVIAGSSYGVVGSTISSTDLLIPAAVNTGVGVYGESTGAVRANGTSSAMYTFAGRFAINPTGAAALGTTQLRSLNNVGDVVQLVRLSSDAPTDGIGSAIVFNIEASTNTTGIGNKSGRIGYKLENPIDAWSRFFITTVSETGEEEKVAIRSNGQVEFFNYARLGFTYDPAFTAQLQGTFTPVAESAITGYNTLYDYSVPAARTVSPDQTQNKGRLDTLRTRHGEYDPATIVINGTTGYNSSNCSVTISKAYFTSLNNMVTVHVQGSMSFTTGGALTRSFDMPLPILSSTALGASDVVFSMTFNNYSMYQYLTTVTGQAATSGTTQRYKVVVNTGASTPPSTSAPFSAIFTYKII